MLIPSSDSCTMVDCCKVLFKYMDWASDVLLFHFTSELHAHSMQKNRQIIPLQLKKKVKGSELWVRRYAHFGKQTLTLCAVPRNALGTFKSENGSGWLKGLNLAVQSYCLPKFFYCVFALESF